MLDAYRTFLASELALLGNASHHAYSFGQANMAKRALERFDADLGDRIPLLLEAAEAAALLAVLDATIAPGAPGAHALEGVRDRLLAARARPADGPA